MSDRKAGKAIEFTCDFCGKTTSAIGGFKDAWAAVKESGWRSFKEGEQWKHKCAECMKKPREQGPGPALGELADDDF